MENRQYWAQIIGKFKAKYLNIKQDHYVLISTLEIILLNKFQFKPTIFSQDIATRLILLKMYPKFGPFLAQILGKMLKCLHILIAIIEIRLLGSFSSK